MNQSYSMTAEERNYLRELARKYLGYAKLPIMEERTRLWYAHNAFRGERPMIVVEEGSFLEDILPPLRCRSDAAVRMERQLLQPITSFDLIGDDKVISPHFAIPYAIRSPAYGVEVQRTYAKDAQGRSLGYTEEHPIKDLQRDLPKLKHGEYSFDRERTYAWKAFVDETFGDILPTAMKNYSLHWHTAPSQRIVELMGLENMMLGMMDNPDGMHALYRFITDDMIAFVKWQEEQGLLVLNNGNDFVGAGSFGFSDELPKSDAAGGSSPAAGPRSAGSGAGTAAAPGAVAAGKVRARDLWGNVNSQETVGISPGMYHEFIYPYYKDLAELYGLVYYGCCEPVHSIWDDSISRLPNLRKVSVSAWCDEEFIGERLRGGKVIYSRKPSPNFIGIEGMFTEEGFATHIRRTLDAARGCTLEIIFRDIYNLSGDRSKPGKGVQIIRRLIDK